jgi:hypothetical protein
MALALIVDSLDAIPEALRSAYVPDGDKFKLDADVPDVTGLKRALESERGLNKAAKDKVAAWERLGVSPEEIETRLEAERKKAEEAALKAGKFDEVLATHLGNAKKERDEAVSTAEKQRESALAIARSAVVGTSLATALTKVKATSEGLDLLTERLGKRVKIEFDDAGNASSSIIDAEGKPMTGSMPNGLANYDDLVKEAIKQYPSLFEGSGGGSGTDPKGQRRDAGGKILTLAEFHALGPTERAAKMAAGFKVVD